MVPFQLRVIWSPLLSSRRKDEGAKLQESEKEDLKKEYIEELAKALSDASKTGEDQEIGARRVGQANSVALAGWDSYLSP